MRFKEVYGPYFFENPANSNNVRTVTTVVYIDLLETEFSGSNPPEVWFQQDGATSHTSSCAMDWLGNHFGNNIISHRSEFPWPPRSPDLRLPMNITHQIFVLPYTSLHLSPIFPYTYLYFPTFPYTFLYFPTFHTQLTLLAKASNKYHQPNICSSLHFPKFPYIPLYFRWDWIFLPRLPINITHQIFVLPYISPLYFPLFPMRLKLLAKAAP